MKLTIEIAFDRYYSVGDNLYRESIKPLGSKAMNAVLRRHSDPKMQLSLFVV